MKIYAGVEKGNRVHKDHCEDRVLVGREIIDQGYYETELNTPVFLAAVSDGVGGRPMGWLAAKTVLETLSQISLENMQDNKQLLETVKLANEKIFRLSRNDKECKGMATTLSLLKISNGVATILHLGDTRVYQLIPMQGIYMLKQLTKDQNNMTWWMELPEYEDYTEQELKTRRGWYAITSYIGMNSEDLEDKVQIIDQISLNGMFILTSDGIHDYIPHHEFRKALSMDAEPKEIIRELMKKAKDNGSVDDQSIIIVKP